MPTIQEFRSHLGPHGLRSAPGAQTEPGETTHAIASLAVMSPSGYRAIEMHGVAQRDSKVRCSREQPPMPVWSFHFTEAPDRALTVEKTMAFEVGPRGTSTAMTLTMT
ncbi:hypothetical protein ACCO45_001229 [Purpureocillium lilacinum]|uniref:Uncharacterized protein n=1 Tax=Purpureocillium lilacinum TaxID=33203 RepID=A0ACC4E6F8_PURLI